MYDRLENLAERTTSDYKPGNRPPITTVRFVKSGWGRVELGRRVWRLFSFRLWAGWWWLPLRSHVDVRALDAGPVQTTTFALALWGRARRHVMGEVRMAS